MPYMNSRIDWIKFDNTFQNTSICCPSRATMLTGQYSTNTKVQTNTEGKNLNEAATLAPWLNAAGYRTGLVGKYLNKYPWNRGLYTPPGWDSFVAFNRSYGYYNYSL